jgi:hypothetical protein
MIIRIALLLLAITASAPAFAWGDDGHKLVCQIAYNRLSDSARGKLDTLVASNARGARTFADTCTYADKWRARYEKKDRKKARAEHHFINLDRSATDIVNETCGVAPADEGCAFTAITSDFEALSNHGKSDAERWRALVFMSHFIGDIHQPLHVSFKDDRGGNYLYIAGDCNILGIEKMHSVWDTCMILRHIYKRNVKTERASSDPLFLAVAKRLANVSNTDAQSWIGQPRYTWADESFKITASRDVEYCVRPQPEGSCAKVGVWKMKKIKGKMTNVRIVDLDDAGFIYSTKYAPVVEERLSKAGVRLADLLEKAL